MATKKDLENEVKRLNNKYCKNTRNHFELEQAYKGYQIVLTGKRDKRSPKKYRYLKGSLGSASSEFGHHYHASASETLKGVRDAEDRGWIKQKVRYHEKNRRK